jgi:hypothetical protein
MTDWQILLARDQAQFAVWIAWLDDVPLSWLTNERRVA